MDAKELKKGESYYYTAGLQSVEVKYLHENVNKYVFTANGITRELTSRDVKNYIEHKN
jgi:hypothetical protein